MRLRVLSAGQRLRAKTALGVIRVVGGTEPDPVVRLIMYRPALFGRAFNRLAASVMRGPSPWSAGEREVFGAATSEANSCRFCAGVHTAIAERQGGSSAVPRVEAVRGLVAKDAITVSDVDQVRAAGVTNEAIEEALYVGFLFNTINRIANALDFEWKTDDDRLKLAKGLDRMSYKVPAFFKR